MVFRSIRRTTVLFFCLTCLFNQDVFAQKETKKVRAYLELGKDPVYSDSVRMYLQSNLESVVVLCYVSIDTTGYIKKHKFFTTYGIGNNLDEGSWVWNSICNTIDTTIQQWKFKPLLWELDNKEKDYENKLNINPRTRPYGGNQSYFIFFHVNSNVLHNPIYLDILESVK